MLKTALYVTLAMGALGTGANAFETAKYDRKIEQAAVNQVAKKMGALRESVDAETNVAVADMTQLPELDMVPTSGAWARPSRTPQPQVFFRIIAGEYGD